MLKVIQVLAHIGSDATLQSDDAIASLLIDSELDTSILEAIVNKDIISLERQLDVCPDVVCFITPAEDDDDDKDDDSTEETNKLAIGL